MRLRDRKSGSGGVLGDITNHENNNVDKASAPDLASKVLRGKVCKVNESRI